MAQWRCCPQRGDRDGLGALARRMRRVRGPQQHHNWSASLTAVIQLRWLLPEVQLLLRLLPGRRAGAALDRLCTMDAAVAAEL